MNSDENRLADIEYSGIAGVSSRCRAAVLRLLQCGDRVTQVRILSSTNRHCLLLTVNTGDLIAIKSGFTSGYGGAGPWAFSYVLQLLEAHDATIKEYEVSADVVERLDKSSLTVSDISSLDASLPVQPERWHDYVLEKHWDRERDGALWREFPPVIPFTIIDGRIIDLAHSFWKNPDEKLLTGYRRLEGIVRKRTGLNEHGGKLFSQAFSGPEARLRWSDIDSGEQAGRSSLFIGTFNAYRNPRAHHELAGNAKGQLAEFLLLNHLYILERTSVTRRRRAGVEK